LTRSKRSEKIVIRQATLADATAVAHLLGELDYPRSPGFARIKIRQLASRNNDRVFVATEQRMVVGFASCHVMSLFHQKGCLCRVTALCVLADRRAAGIGKQLMRAVEKFARSRGCVKIEITSGKRRKSAHEFYRRIGYLAVSARFVKEL